MRRAAAVLLTLLLGLMVCPAAAAPATPYDPALMTRYPGLTQAQQALCDLLYDAVVRQDAEVTLPDDTRYDDVTAAMSVLFTDCPELPALDIRYTTRYYQEHPETALSVQLSYTMDVPQTQAITSALLDAAQALISQAPASAYDRELFLHDALCDRVVYDLSAPNASNACGALLDGRASCEGYAEAFALLCRMAGLRCGLVTGTADDGTGLVSHAWNIVYVDGVPTLVDATWNDQDALGMTTHWYFNLTTAQMASDHQPDATAPLPDCVDASLNWHVRSGVMAPSDADGIKALLFDRLTALIDADVPVNLRCEDAAGLSLLLSSLDAWLDEYNAAHGADGFYGSYAISQSPAQRCFLLMRR